MVILAILGLLLGVIALGIGIMFVVQRANPKMAKPRLAIIFAYFSLAALFFTLASFAASQLN